MKAPDLIAGVFSQVHPEGYQRDNTLRDTCACQLVMTAGFSADWLALTCLLNCDYPLIGNSVGDAPPSLLNSE